MNDKSYNFFDFEIDITGKRLLKNGQVIPLQPKVFDTLVIFAERPEELISREELMTAIWLETNVEEANLRVIIHNLRKALGKNANGADYVETVPKRGYRLNARITEESCGSDEKASRQVPEKRRIARRFWLLPILVAVFSGILVWAFVWTSDGTRKPTGPMGLSRIAVLPFVPFGDKEKTIQLGLADTMIKTLSKLESVEILPAGSVREFADGNPDPVLTGKRLDVDGVLTGNYRFEGGSLSVVATLSRSSDNSTLWTETFTAIGKTEFELESAVALRVARLLSLKIASVEAEQNLADQKINPEAAQSYLTAARIWRSEEFSRREEMLALFEKSILAEPAWTMAHVAYAESLLSADIPSVDWNKAEQAALRTIEIDASLAPPYAMLGEIHHWRDWNWDGAESEFKRSISLDPQFATARYKYAQFLRIKRRFGESTEEIKRAIELEPFSPSFYAALCEVYSSDRKLDLAIEACRTSLQLDPKFEWSKKLLFWIYVQRKMYPEIAELYVNHLSPEQRKQSALAAAVGKKDLRIYWSDSIRLLLARTGNRANPVSLAMHYLLIDDKEKCLKTLEEAYETRAPAIPRIFAEPMFEPIREEPRFVAIVQKIGLKK